MGRQPRSDGRALNIAQMRTKEWTRRSPPRGGRAAGEGGPWARSRPKSGAPGPTSAPTRPRPTPHGRASSGTTAEPAAAVVAAAPGQTPAAGGAGRRTTRAAAASAQGVLWTGICSATGRRNCCCRRTRCPSPPSSPASGSTGPPSSSPCCAAATPSSTASARAARGAPLGGPEPLGGVADRARMGRARYGPLRFICFPISYASCGSACSGPRVRCACASPTRPPARARTHARTPHAQPAPRTHARHARPPQV